MINGQILYYLSLGALLIFSCLVFIIQMKLKNLQGTSYWMIKVSFDRSNRRVRMLSLYYAIFGAGLVIAGLLVIFCKYLMSKSL